jgi:mevalonate kinase
MLNNEMDREKKYYAKLMLAGEYGVIAGCDAITVPFKNYFCRLAKRDEKQPNDAVLQSVASIRKLLTYIHSLPRNSFFASPDTRKLENLLKQGYYIDSDIPLGYGIGSSGAVSALIYDQFFHTEEATTLQQQRKDLATLESCFHGKSSGVDAMTCYTGKPLHFKADGQIVDLKQDPLNTPGEYRFFLLDSVQVFDTAPLVNIFLEKMEDPLFSEVIKGDYCNLIRKFIGALDPATENDPALIFRAISDLQWRYFREMIPGNMEDAWINGQVSNAYYLKLNGSGGGFMLGITHGNSKEETAQMLNGHNIIWLGN